MARIVSLSEIDPKLRQHLLSLLRSCDEAIVLPQSSRSTESGSLKNVVLRLNGEEGGLSSEVFSPNWFMGVSLVPVPNEKAEMLLSSSAKRRNMLRKLADSIKSEMADSQLQVGPDIECDEHDRDIKHWIEGFDAPGCCAGLYSALQSREPESSMSGMSRVHRSYYLLCKAGAGVAGQTFHARLCLALSRGATLDEALSEGGNPGARAMRRVSTAARRNRGRIIAKMAETLQFFCVDTIGDNAGPVGGGYRTAIPSIDATYNTLTNVSETESDRSVWQYAAGCVDSSLSQGVLTSSNVAEGFVAFASSNGDTRVHIYNDAHSCTPFSTPRLMSTRDSMLYIVEKHKRTANANENTHPDHEWIRDRFSWTSKDFGTNVDIEPPCLWGSHESESFLAEWARELGVSKLSPIRLQPELVSLSALEPGKLRVAVKSIQATLQNEYREQNVGSAAALI